MISCTITRLGHKGDGIADGPIYAPRTLPGETVRGTLDGAQLTDIRIESPSDRRVKPPCPHYNACGGCQLMHADDSFVETFKRDVVRSALSAQGIETADLPVRTSPPLSRRRASFAARRTKKGALAGFHGRASGTIVAIPNCQLLHLDLLAALPMAEALAQHGGSRKGELTVVVTQSNAGLDVAVSGGKPLDGPLQITLAQLAEQHALARLVWDDEIIATRQPPTQPFGNAMVVPPPGAFLQATHDGEATLQAAVQHITQGAARIVDLFAGCGTFALPLAQSAEVHAVEGSAEMLAALDAGWRMTKGLKPVTTEARDLFRRPLMTDELARFDAAVIDPPRAGGEAQVRELTPAQIPRIAYVSCNPISFARDAAILIAAGYEMGHIQVVDQFRWSAHAELVAEFTAPSRS